MVLPIRRVVALTVIWECLVLTALLSGATVQPFPDEDDPKAVIVFLTRGSRPHGLVERFLNKDTKRLLSKVRDEPSAYMNVLTEFLTLPEQIDESLDVTRLEGTLGLLGSIGRRHRGTDVGKAARKAVRDFFDQVASELEVLDLKMQSPNDPTENAGENQELTRSLVRALSGLQRGNLRILGRFNDPYAVDHCVKTVEQERKYMRGTWVVMLRYLEKVAPLRPDIRPKLEKMYDDPGSSLHNNPQLLRVLKAIDRAEADKADAKKERTTPRTP